MLLGGSFMEVACPKCGRKIEYTPDRSFALSCPKCGKIPPVEDSQVITISDGYVGGPGLRNLDDREQQLTIRDGRAIAQKDPNLLAEESVIDAGPKPTIKVDSPTLNPLNHPVFQNKVTTATVEDQLVVETKKEVKPKPQPTAGPALRFKQQARTSVRPPQQARPIAPQHSKKTPSIQRKALMRSYLILVLIALLLLAFIGMLVMLWLNREPNIAPAPVHYTDIWNKAEQSYQQGYISYQEAQIQRSVPKVYQQKLKLAQAQYMRALELGETSLKQQIDFCIQQNKMDPAEAEKATMNYRQKLQDWQRDLQDIQNALSQASK